MPREADIERGSVMWKHLSEDAKAELWRWFVSRVLASITILNQSRVDGPQVDGETTDISDDGKIEVKDEGLTMDKLSDDLELRLVVTPEGGALSAGRVPYCTTAGNTVDTPSIVQSTNINIDSSGRVSVDPSNGAAGITPAAGLHVIGSVSSAQPALMATQPTGAAVHRAIQCDGAEGHRVTTLGSGDFPYTVLPTDHTIYVSVDTGTAALVLTLPPTTGNEGRRLWIYDIANGGAGYAGTRPIAVTADSADRINAAASKNIGSNGGAMIVEFTDRTDGSGNGIVLGHYLNQA